VIFPDHRSIQLTIWPFYQRTDPFPVAWGEHLNRHIQMPFNECQTDDQLEILESMMFEKEISHQTQTLQMQQQLNDARKQLEQLKQEKKDLITTNEKLKTEMEFLNNGGQVLHSKGGDHYVDVNAEYFSIDNNRSDKNIQTTWTPMNNPSRHGGASKMSSPYNNDRSKARTHSHSATRTRKSNVKSQEPLSVGPKLGPLDILSNAFKKKEREPQQKSNGTEKVIEKKKKK